MKDRVELLIVVGLLILIPTVIFATDTREESGGAVLSFPEDHRFHFNPLYRTDRFIEWYYFTGILPDAGSGEEYGFFVCLYSAYPEYLDEFAFFFQIGINDPNTGQTIYRDVPCPLAEIETGEVPGSGLTYWRFTSTYLTLTHWEEDDIWELWAENAASGADRVTVDLILTNSGGDYYPETPSAIIEMGDCPGEERSPETMFGLSYYFTHPTLETTGTLHFRNLTRTVSGKTWMDRQWGNFNTCNLFYDWFSFRFDDGSYMMAWNFIDHDYRPMPEMRYLASFPTEGEPRYWYGEEAFSLSYERYWTSAQSGRVYPVGQTIVTPIGTFAVDAYFNDQENRGGEVAPEPFWEGMCRVYENSVGGPAAGQAYLEMFRPEGAQNPVSTASGDYDGDGTAEIAVFRSTTGLWAIRDLSRFYFGGSSDIPVPGDYDGDGTSEAGIFRPSGGLWAIRGITRLYFGGGNDIPIPRDYDGTGRERPAIFRHESGLWALRELSRFYFGGAADLPVPADYTGNGRTDPGIYRKTAALWAVRGVTRAYLGGPSQLPVPGDYDGDGTAGEGVFRPADSRWQVKLSSGGISQFFLGGNGDFPVPAGYLGGDQTAAGIFRPATGLWAVRDISRFYFGTTDDLPATR